MDIKRSIIRTASELFFKYGIRSVTIEDICKELRISKKTFYAHFRQKDELVEALLCEVQQHRASSMSIGDEENVIDKLLRDVSMFKRLHEKRNLSLFYDLKKYYPDLYKKHLDACDATSVMFTLDILKKGVQQGLFRDDFDIEMMGRFLYLKTNQEFHTLHQESKVSMSQIADFMIESFVRLVANETGMQYYLEKRKAK